MVRGTRSAGMALLGILCAVCLSGCFEVEEWVRVGANGLTTLSMKLRLGIGSDKQPEGLQLATQQLEGLGVGLSGVRLKGSKTEHVNGQMLAVVEVEANHLADLTALYRSVAGAKPKGETGGPEQVQSVLSNGSFYRVKKTGNRLHISRTLLPPKTATTQQKKKGKDSKMGEDMAQMMMGGMFMRFSLTVPGKIVAHDAETLDGQTLHWVYPVSYLTTHKVELWVDVEATPETVRALLK